MSRWRLLADPGHLFALGGGLGLLPLAPGTFGTLPGFALAAGVRALVLPLPLAGTALALLFGLGIAAAARTARALGAADPGAVVCDEYIAFAGLLLCLPDTLAAQAWAFLLFRLFDATKPFPVSWVDRRVHGGPGIMLDDLLAAGMALLAYAALAALRMPGGPGW